MLPRILTYGALSALLLACTVDNKRGDTGASGANGKDGTNGTDGTNGKDGSNGQDGANGTDGLNGVAAVVYDSFDRSAACTINGQLIFVNGDSSFYVCKDQKWTAFSIKGDQGEAGPSAVVTLRVDVGASCSVPDQLVYDKARKEFYTCDNSSWKTLAIKGEKGDPGAIVVTGNFNASSSCPQTGNLIFHAPEKLFYYCASNQWVQLDVRGNAGRDGQTAFVENENQLPACSQSNLGALYLLKDTGSIKACTFVNNIGDWKFVYQAPNKQGSINQSLIDDCVASSGARRDFYIGMLGVHSILNDKAPVLSIMCPKLAEIVRDAESWSFADYVFRSMNPIIGGSRLTDNLADTLQYFVHIKNMTFPYTAENFALTSLDKMPVMPNLRTLTISNRATFSLGKLDKFPELIELSITRVNLIGEDGKSPLANIQNLTKLNELDLLEVNLTTADLVEIAKLKNLRILRVGPSPVDLSPLADMGSLARLIYTGDLERKRCPFKNKDGVQDVSRCQ